MSLYQGQYSFAGKSMLWLDTDVDAISSLTMQLTYNGLNITKVETCRTAWAELRTNHYDFFMTNMSF
ncbi:MAG: hypothetical protein HGA85_07560 [Nanoarchaeota archaeon]|nr:hypothetical protein [Nanoarchaeota archaeon]